MSEARHDHVFLGARHGEAECNVRATLALTLAMMALEIVDSAQASAQFHEHAHLHADHNLRAAVAHVIADAAVSIFVIIGLSLAAMFGWCVMDPLAALLGAVVIASWSLQLIRAIGAVLLDMNPDANLAAQWQAAVERDGDHLLDLHLWRPGPGHLGAIVSVRTKSGLCPLLASYGRGVVGLGSAGGVRRAAKSRATV